MKSLTRLTSLLICLAMLFSCVLVRAEETAEEAIVYGIEENALITALGIAEYEEADLSAPITRGEFYMLLCKANAYPETVTQQTLFSDLAVGADYETWTKTLYKVGIITTTRDGKVNIGDPITGTEATSLVMRTLGYGPRAEALGGFPTGYVAVANQADVTDGMEEVLSMDLTKGMAVQLIYNALHADMMIQTVGKGKDEFKVLKDTNLLNTAFGIEKIEGVVDVDITRVVGVNDVHPFHIEIEGFMMESRAIANPYDYLGYHVEAYYTDKRLDEPKVVYMQKTNYNEEDVIALDDIDSISSGSVRAYNNEKGKYENYKFKKGVSVVVNGAATKQAFSAQLFEGLHGNIKLLDNTGDGVADVVFINAYENIIVSHYDSKVKTIYDKYDNTRKLVFDNTTNDPYVILYDVEGKEVQPSALVKDAVVSVYHAPEDAYQKYVRAYISTSVAQGEIESIEDDDEIVIYGKTYKLIESAKERVKNLLKPGTPVKFYLDANGEIADGVIDNSSEAGYGYIVAAGTESGLDTKMMFKFYTTSGTFLDAYAAKNIRIDGVKYANTDIKMLENLYSAAVAMNGVVLPATEEIGSAKIAYYLEQKAPLNSVVKYVLNGDGEVSAIDTIMNDATKVADRNSVHTNNNSFFGVKQSAVYYRAYSNHRTIGPNVVLNANTYIMYYPISTGADDRDALFNLDEYDTGKFTSFVNHNKYFSNDIWAFYESDKQVVSNLTATSLTGGSGGGVDETYKLAVVQGLCRMLDPVDGETEVTGVTILSSSGTVKIPVKDGKTIPVSVKEVAAKDDEGKNMVDTNGDPVYARIEGFTGYTDVSGEFKTGAIRPDQLQIGDVIRYGKDSRGYLGTVDLWQRPGYDTLYADHEFKDYYNGNIKASSGAYSHTTAIRRGYVYQALKEGFYVYFSDEFTGDREADLAILSTKTIDDCEFVYYTVTSFSAFRYEKSELDGYKVSSITGGDLKSYQDTGADCSFVLLHTYNGQPWSLVEFAE